MKTDWPTVKFLFCAFVAIFNVILGVWAKNTLHSDELAELFFWSAFLMAVGTLGAYMSMKDGRS